MGPLELKYDGLLVPPGRRSVAKVIQRCANLYRELPN